MIIKFLVNDSWQLLDGINSLQYTRMGDHDGVCEGDADLTNDIDDSQIIDNVTDYTGTLFQKIGDSKGFPGRVSLIIGDGKSFNSQIIAYAPIYVMNDNGKTIETI